MNKIKIFYSYSHKDEDYRENLEKHLATLRDDQLIDEWHDRKIDAGDDLNEEIEKNMTNAHIILFLFSSDFMASESCKREIKRTLQLKKEKGTEFIPIILRPCSWKNNNSISDIKALPLDGKPIILWDNQDEAWVSVYEGIKNKVEKIRSSMLPKLKNAFKKKLLNNPIQNFTLDKLFVYPDIIEDKVDLKLERNEIDSEELKNISTFEHKYILIEGEEQSGKTSLCNMLFLHYYESEFYPIIINGEEISGKADVLNITNNVYKKQYDCTNYYNHLDKNSRILLVDDVDEKLANFENFSKFITSSKKHFEYIIIFIDKLSNLSDQSLEHNAFLYFHNFSIRSLGHRKRNELIKRCISHDENTEFDINNNDHLAKLDRDTKHINTIIGTNIVPSYPVFIVTIFDTVESALPQDLSKTSYGHCYQAMITMSLAKYGIKAGDIDGYFNFLTELAYFMFEKDSKKISVEELEKFKRKYIKQYIDINLENVIRKLKQANIIKLENNLYNFHYIYIYYYFVAKYIADKADGKPIKKQVANLISNIHLTENANIIIFIAHHTRDKNFLDDVQLSAMSAFNELPEATLTGKEKNIITAASKNLEKRNLPNANHDIEKERNRNLQKKDELESASLEEEVEDDRDEEIEKGDEENFNRLRIEIKKSAKSMEIIGQILKNQYGSLEKNKLLDLFEEGQNAGLRFIKSFMNFIENDRDFLEYLVQLGLEKITEEKNIKMSTLEKKKESQKIVARFSYSIIFGWMNKIVDSLGYNKLIEIADAVAKKNNSVSSKLINLSIHTWHTKNLDFNKIKSMYNEFKNDGNHLAIHMLKDIVSRHIYMHPVEFRDKQRLQSLLNFSIQGQVSAQKKLK